MSKTTSTVRRFLKSPRSLLGFGPVSPSLFRDLADATAHRLVSNPSKGEARVSVLLDLADSACARSRALGLQTMLLVIQGDYDAALVVANKAAVEHNGCPYCHGSSSRMRAIAYLGRKDLDAAHADITVAMDVLRACDPAGYGGALMTAARLEVASGDLDCALEYCLEAQERTAPLPSKDKDEPLASCPWQTSRARAASYNRDAATNVVLTLGMCHDNPAALASARERIPQTRQLYGRYDHRPKGICWWLEGQLEVDACIAAGYLEKKGGTWRKGRPSKRARAKVVSRYTKALRFLCRAKAAVEVAALLADIGAVDDATLRDVLVGDHELRADVDKVLARLPPALAEDVTELRAAIAGTDPPVPPEIAQVRDTLLAVTALDTSVLPSPLTESVEEVRECAALVVSEVRAWTPAVVPPGERLRLALVSLRGNAEDAGAPGAVVRYPGRASLALG